MDSILEEAARMLRTILGHQLEIGLQAGEDSAVILTVDGRNLLLRTVSMPRPGRAAASLLASRLDKGERTLVLADYINTAVATLLREANVAYLDLSGNCFLRDKGFLILIQGNKPIRPGPGREPVRAFKTSGLKIIFALLLDPDWINRPYREIAEAVGVTHGTVQYVLADLIRLGFFVEVSKDLRKPVRMSDLLDRWTTNFAEVLRPKLIHGRYRFARTGHPSQWMETELDPSLSLWGGEPAADLWTGYLKPQILTLYSREPVGELMRKLRLIPDPEGELEVLDMFWNPELLKVGRSVRHTFAVQPLLSYADLIATGESRNLEVARLIREHHLSHLQ